MPRDKFSIGDVSDAEAAAIINHLLSELARELAADLNVRTSQAAADRADDIYARIRSIHEARVIAWEQAHSIHRVAWKEFENARPF